MKLDNERIIMKNKYIIQLNDKLQNEIEVKLRQFYKEELDLTEQEIEEELELAMSGRIIDLEETIDISQFNE